MLKADLHSANVSRATETIRWRMVFFSLHLRRMKCSVYFALFTNQKQPLKCVRQNSYQGLWSYISYIIRQGVLLLVKLQTGGINKLLKWNISQAFLKVLTSAQKLHCRTTVFEERLPMTVSALKHDHEIIIIKSAESSKLWRSSRK